MAIANATIGPLLHSPCRPSTCPTSPPLCAGNLPVVALAARAHRERGNLPIVALTVRGHCKCGNLPVLAHAACANTCPTSPLPCAPTICPLTHLACAPAICLTLHSPSALATHPPLPSLCVASATKPCTFVFLPCFWLIVALPLVAPPPCVTYCRLTHPPSTPPPFVCAGCFWQTLLSLPAAAPFVG